MAWTCRVPIQTRAPGAAAVVCRAVPQTLCQVAVGPRDVMGQADLSSCARRAWYLHAVKYMT